MGSRSAFLPFPSWSCTAKLIELEAKFKIPVVGTVRHREQPKSVQFSGTQKAKGQKQWSFLASERTGVHPPHINADPSMKSTAAVPRKCQVSE